MKKSEEKKNEKTILGIITKFIKEGVNPLFGRVFTVDEQNLSPTTAQEAWNGLLRKGKIVIKKAGVGNEPSVEIGKISRKCIRCSR